ncbi:aKG-HExxH-type peptide beta-hydroxylase [Actinoplanes sp. NPDC049265]|uniref:aKG-HExxH-type peptide beta-hydroxylase n=1 Tax=Actinoplanes sp. NPDC049265 TaxID=3363902 RepID=UPI003723BE19
MPSTYRLSRARLAELAAGGGRPETISFLARTQLSRRLLLLRLLRDQAQPGLGPLPPVDDAWTVLERAREHDRAAFESVVMYPQIGNWIAYTLRVHDKDGAPGGAAPAWADYGQIHTVALVAAARSGLTWRTGVPLRDGRVTLPGLGQATFGPAGEWDHATAETHAGRIRLGHRGRTITVPADFRRDADGWQGLRLLTAGTDPGLRVTLDDLDPFRNLADPVGPERLTEAEVASWQGVLAEAWALFRDTVPADARPLSMAVSSLAPLARADQDHDEEIRSASTAEAFGGIILSAPSNAVDLAATLGHEYRHILLGCLMHLCVLNDEHGRARLYAPWRDDPRPIGGLLQGIYAFQGIASFFRARAGRTDGTERRAALFAYALTRAQTRAGLAAARASGELTDLGQEFLDGLEAAMRRWASDELPADIVRLAGLATTAHRITWLLRNRRPAPGSGAALARAWSARTPADRPAPGTGTVEPAADPPQLSTTWTRPLRLAVNRPVPVTSPETALIAGDVAAARSAFLQRISADPADPDAWTGLALCFVDAGAAEQARALITHPDVVVAGYRALAAAGDPPAADALVAWAGR